MLRIATSGRFVASRLPLIGSISPASSPGPVNSTTPPRERERLRIVTEIHTLLQQTMRRMKMRAFLMPALIILGGCELIGSTVGTKSGPITEDHSDIEDPRERWEAYGLTDYAIHQTRSCFCLGPYEYVAVVRGNDVVAIEEARPPVEGDVQLDMFWTVDEIFDYLEQTREQDPVVFEVSYHPRFGYPTEIQIDVSYEIADEELSMTLSDLKRLE